MSSLFFDLIVASSDGVSLVKGLKTDELSQKLMCVPDILSHTGTLNFEYNPCPGGVLRFEFDRGVPLEPQNPYPSLRVILAKKGTHF